MKQVIFFKKEGVGSEEPIKYSSKVESPIYEAKNKKPHITELYDLSRTKRLISKIKESDISDMDKKFLLEAASRHTVFNYEKIADYYANSDATVQDLMEDSALIIIDFEKAIENGFVELTENIKKQYLEESPVPKQK